MFETNIQNNSTLISLARAAELTGYHQDYLGQLCRLGRLPAKKVGRNWFTTDDALRNLTPQEPATEENSESETQSISENINTPALAQTITVSRVEGLPIMVRTIPLPVQHTNNVQTIANRLRIESLQREVKELRELLSRIVAEVNRHSKLLESKSENRTDAIRHSYVSNFDLNIPEYITQGSDEPAPGLSPAPQIWIKPNHELSFITVLSAASALALIAYMITTMSVGTFWGNGSDIKTVYHHSPPMVDPTEKLSQPAVAGESVENMIE